MLHTNRQLVKESGVTSQIYCGLFTGYSADIICSTPNKFIFLGTLVVLQIITLYQEEPGIYCGLFTWTYKLGIVIPLIIMVDTISGITSIQWLCSTSLSPNYKWYQGTTYSPRYWLQRAGCSSYRICSAFICMHTKVYTISDL